MIKKLFLSLSLLLINQLNLSATDLAQTEDDDNPEVSSLPTVRAFVDPKHAYHIKITNKFAPWPTRSPELLDFMKKNGILKQNADSSVPEFWQGILTQVKDKDSSLVVVNKTIEDRTMPDDAPFLHAVLEVGDIESAKALLSAKVDPLHSTTEVQSSTVKVGTSINMFLDGLQPGTLISCEKILCLQNLSIYILMVQED